MRPEHYRELCSIERENEPLTETVATDEMTDMADECFDMPFDGVCRFYPFRLPVLPDYRIMAVVGKSGSGKSTLLKSIHAEDRPELNYLGSECLPEAYIRKHAGRSEGEIAKKFVEDMRLVGLDPSRCCFKHYPQLSEGEKFRADTALKLSSGAVFDEFTSMVDREIAEIVCEGMKKIAERDRLGGIVVCSCHKDFIPWLEPDVVVDLDDSKVYVRGEEEQSEKHQFPEELIGTVAV